MIYSGKRYSFGNLDRRQLSIDVRLPYSMTEYQAGFFVLRWRYLLSPYRWWRAIRCRNNWRFRWTYYRGQSHRCYCREGLVFDPMLHIAGFGVCLWYSSYWGEVPCICDKVISEDLPDI